MIPPLPQFGQGRPLVSSLDQFKKPAALERYVWAASAISANGWTRVIDAACGCGYGSWILAEEGGAVDVRGVDIDPVAIEVAQKHWTRLGTVFFTQDIRHAWIAVDRPMDAVVSIETIEHVEEPREFLTKFREWAPALVATVPNELTIPFDPKVYRHHYRHYKPMEFEALLKEFYSKVVLEASNDGKELRAVARDG